MTKLINDIGYVLIDNIINIKNDNNKIKLLSEIKQFNKDIMDKKEEIIKNRNIYLTKYDIPRKNNNDNNDKYLKDKEILYNKWKQSKTVKDLYSLLALKRPEYNEVIDIYTAIK